VFGDVKKGNGDPALVMFGEKVTPNHHRLAEEFVLFDSLYCNGQVSRDGHPWSTRAYNTDYTARDWHLTYSGRKGVDDDDDADLAKAPSDYLWDARARAGLSYRSYGEYGRRVSQPDDSVKMEGAVPGLLGHFCPDYAAPKEKGKKVRDTENVETFLKEYRAFEEKGTMPRFIVMSLGEDHTTGTAPGTFTPPACVASNDVALGRLVEAVSHGKLLWKETAIFVIEDNAQSGRDHVDAHRTAGLVISPYVKRRGGPIGPEGGNELARGSNRLLQRPPPRALWSRPASSPGSPSWVWSGGVEPAMCKEAVAPAAWNRPPSGRRRYSSAWTPPAWVTSAAGCLRPRTPGAAAPPRCRGRACRRPAPRRRRRGHRPRPRPRPAGGSKSRKRTTPGSYGPALWTCLSSPA
jgi:hypothetical protein